MGAEEGNLPLGYDEFGVPLVGAGSPTGNPFGFTGYQQDNISGLFYAQARYYQPTMGRFTAEDGARDGLNWYIYCKSDPLRFIDPSGLSWKDMLDGFTGDLLNEATRDYPSGNSYNTKEEFYRNPTEYNASAYAGSQTYKFFEENDLVFDASISADIGPVSATVGYSYLVSIQNKYSAGYVHAGLGKSVSISVSPVTPSFAVGIVKNAPTPEGYAGWFLDGSVYVGGGVESCFWPGGASATSIVLTPSVGVGGRVDYYWLVFSNEFGSNGKGACLCENG